MATYPYVPSYWDNYGRRDTTLGLMLHMAEGTGTVGYLDNKGNIPPRGVSVHFVCETTGRMVRMLDLHAASGSLNPSDRSTDKPYYGHSHLVDVLGSWWTNPNEAVISVEIEGFARTGPNGRQRDALVDWAADMVSQFPTIRGALGHADQTNTKGCPGTTAAMKSVFASIGGHGLWTPQEEPVDMPGLSITNLAASPGTLRVKGAGHSYIRVGDGSNVPVPDGWPGPEGKPVISKGTVYTDFTLQSGGVIKAGTPVYVVGDLEAAFLAVDVTFTPAPTPDLAAARAAGREEYRGLLADFMEANP